MTIMINCNVLYFQRYYGPTVDDPNKMDIREELERIKFELRSLIERLQGENDNLTKELSVKNSTISTLQEILDENNVKYEHLNSKMQTLVNVNRELGNDIETLNLNISVITEKIESMQKSNQELEKQVSRLNRELFETEQSFPGRLEKSECVKSLKERILHLEKEVREKNQVRICYALPYLGRKKLLAK